MGVIFDCESPRGVEDATSALTLASGGGSRPDGRSDAEAEFLRMLIAMHVDSQPISTDLNSTLQVRGGCKC